MQYETQRMMAGTKVAPPKPTFVQYAASEPKGTAVSQTVSKVEATSSQKELELVEQVPKIPVKPAGGSPLDLPTINDMRMSAINDSLLYELFIHLADSIVWIMKDYKVALQLYDSAQTIKPQASYPKKQIKAVKQFQSERDVMEAR